MGQHVPVRAFNRSHERAIQKWIRSVLREIARYKTKHRRLLNEAARTLELNSLPTDIVFNDVLPFLELPSFTFDGED